MASTMDSMMPSLPGSYHFQHGQTFGSNKLHAIFQPPVQSPTLSRRTSQIPRPTSRSSDPHSSRKRPRLDSNTSYLSRPLRPSRSNTGRSTHSTPFTLDGSYDHVSGTASLESSGYSCDDRNPLSPSPLANSEYRLAGGLDTPSASLEHDLDELAQTEAEKDYRTNRYANTSSTHSATLSTVDGSERLFAQSQILVSSAGSRSSVGRKRARSSGRATRSLTGWDIRGTAWALTGGLAGRVFNFCLNTAFRGFRAGGGEAYQIATGRSACYIPNGGSGQLFNTMSVEDSCDLGGFVEDYMNSPQSRFKDFDHSYTPATIKNDWQIIDAARFADSEDERSPARKRSRASVAGARQRPTSDASLANGRVGSSGGASYASPRARSSMTVSAQPPQQSPCKPQRNLTTSDNPFPALRRARPSLADHRRSQSHFSANTTFSMGQNQASLVRSSSSASMRQNQAETGLSPDVLQYRRKLKAREKAQDENLQRLNAQLRDMIREGREALGSKIEIVDETGGRASLHADEGFYEDGWN